MGPRVQGFGLGIRGMRFRAWGLGLKVKGSGSRVWGLICLKIDAIISNGYIGIARIKKVPMKISTNSCY